MLKSYFSRQQRRSRSSLFDTSTSFCRSRSRNRRAWLRSLISKLQRVQNAAARLVMDIGKYSHLVSPN